MGQYIYESDTLDQNQKILIEQLRERGDEVIDAVDWDDSERRDFYEQTLYPRSIENGLRLRGRVRTHKAGNINFHAGVFVVGRKFFVGTEEIQKNV